MWDQNTLFPGDYEGEKFVADEHDEVRTTVKPQIHVTARKY
jgi:hypothetical protein